MSGIYEVLSPWAEADPVPLRGLSPRLDTLRGKRIGLFLNIKRAAPLIHDAVERELRLRFPDIQFTRYLYRSGGGAAESPEWPRVKEWAEGVDGVIGAVGD